MNPKELKKLLATPEFKERLRKYALETIERRMREWTECVKKEFPEHAEHSLPEQLGDFEYFDAMFLSVTVDCSCGEKLKLTRAMLCDD